MARKISPLYSKTRPFGSTYDAGFNLTSSIGIPNWATIYSCPLSFTLRGLEALSFTGLARHLPFPPRKISRFLPADSTNKV